MQTSDKYWNKYSEDFHFLFWFRNNHELGDNRKIAISVSKRTWEVAELYNGADNKIPIATLPSYIMEAIKNDKDKYNKERKLKLIASMFTLNPQTNRYDYAGGLGWNSLNNLVSEDKDGFIINFGKITGYFDCSDLDLVSLKGAPTEVSGGFYCNSNQLTSLKGAPQKVGGYFSCYNNQLTSLEGAPQTVGKDFRCSENQLTSLKGAPQKVGGSFDCANNQLTSLEGAPHIVDGYFNCNKNQLSSLEGAPRTIGGSFYCYKNPNLHSLDGLGEVKGKIFKAF